MMAATATANRPPFDEFRMPLFVSAAIHVGAMALVIAAGIVGYLGSHENSWGGPGSSVAVGLVGNAPAIPLPEPDVQTPSRVVDESKGLYQSPPKAPPKAEPDATPLPKFEKNKAPKYVPRPPETLTQPPPKYRSNPSKTLENPAPPPPNAVPYGGGGAPSIPRSSTTFTMGNTPTQAGLSFNGAAGGDFGARFGYYVEAVQRRVSSNWLQSTIDPGVLWAPRVVLTFDVLRDGTVTNIQITQSSNNYSVDTSAERAVQASSPFQPLPGGYSGSRVSVEFYFDYKKQ
jgi:protein TonB